MNLLVMDTGVLVAMVTIVFLDETNGFFLRLHLKNSPNSSSLAEHKYINVSHTSPPYKRVPRATHHLNMPKNLHFRFRMQDSDVNLRMTKLGGGGFQTLFPVYKAHGLGSPERVHFPADMIKNTAFYILEGQRRVMLVNRSSHSFYSLNGYLEVKGQEYLISSDHKSEQGEGHTISMVTSKNKMDSDDIVFLPEGYQEISNQAPGWKCPAFMRRYIELGMSTDFAVFQRFMDYTDDRSLLALLHMYLYYGFIGFSVSTRFESLSDYCPLSRVTVAPSSLFVCLEPRFCPWSEDHVMADGRRINVHQALPAYRMYASSERGPKGDHRMFFSGYQLSRSNGDTGVLGVAYLGTACNNKWDMSMVEERFEATTASIASHELGHSFGANHDSSQQAVGCSNKERYIMTSYISFPSSDDLASRPYQFSNCSAAAIFAHLSDLKGSCTHNRPWFKIGSQFLAGQFYNADRQCELAKGVGSFFCRRSQQLRQFSQMCVGTLCAHPPNPTKCTKMIPLHHTSCGNNKWCEKGRCVYSKYAPPTPSDDCPQGDDPKARCQRPKSCTNQTMIKIVCCQTCRRITSHSQVPMTLASAENLFMSVPSL